MAMQLDISRISMQFGVDVVVKLLLMSESVRNVDNSGQDGQFHQIK